jgi:hypothetical protein
MTRLERRHTLDAQKRNASQINDPILFFAEAETSEVHPGDIFLSIRGQFGYSLSVILGPVVGCRRLFDN